MAEPASPPRLRTRRGLMFTALPAITVIAALGGLLAVQHRSSAVDERRAETARLAVAAATNAQRFVEDQWEILAAVAASPAVREERLGAMRLYLLDAGRSRRFTSLGFIDRRGRSRVSTTRPLDAAALDLADRPYVQAGLKGMRTVSNVLIGRGRARPLVAFGYPTSSPRGRPSGLVVGSVALDEFDAPLRRLLYAPGAGETVFDGVDHVIVGDEPVRGLQAPATGLPLAVMRARGAGLLDDVRTSQGRRLIGFAGVPGTGWVVVVDRPYGDVVGPLDTALWAELGALVLLAGSGVALTLATGRRLDRLDHARDEALSEQREIAIRLQRSLLPDPRDLPQPPGLTVHAGYTPAQGAMSVGGDWYDVVDMGDGRIALSVGDVAGHGLNAAAIMGQLRSAVRALALARHDPANALAQLDRFSSMLAGRPLATVFYAVLDPAGLLRYAAAGHPPPLVVRADASTEFLEAGRSPLLGVDPVEPRPEGELTLGAGDVLIVYTDGLIERPEASIDVGLAALAERAGAWVGDCAALTESLLATVPEPRRDDAAVLCVRVDRVGPQAQPSSVPS